MEVTRENTLKKKKWNICYDLDIFYTGIETETHTVGNFLMNTNVSYKSVSVICFQNFSYAVFQNNLYAKDTYFGVAYSIILYLICDSLPPV